MADAVRQVAGAEAAIINGGSIRADIARGAITRKNVYKALPFPDYIVVVRLTGAQLRKALEHGVSGPGPRGRFPQVSGLTFTYRPQAPPGRRVQQILVSGRPLEADKIYTVATNNFLAAGGDGYQVFAEALKPKVGRPARCGPGTTVREAVITYIKSQGKI
ncbi:MAG: 5'-nucleotidase C-terminal domain-containing protein, partial [Deltaproteobacteria bacterium]|nr:5'-nucleotidase C-terminal domain-containing protein [Deltaproteobacteria bacterium]